MSAAVRSASVRAEVELVIDIFEAFSDQFRGRVPMLDAAADIQPQMIARRESKPWESARVDARSRSLMKAAPPSAKTSVLVASRSLGEPPPRMQPIGLRLSVKAGSGTVPIGSISAVMRPGGQSFDAEHPSVALPEITAEPDHRRGSHRFRHQLGRMPPESSVSSSCSSRVARLDRRCSSRSS